MYRIKFSYVILCGVCLGSEATVSAQWWIELYSFHGGSVLPSVVVENGGNVHLRIQYAAEGLLGYLP